LRKFAQTQDILTSGRSVFDILKESIVKIKHSLDVLNTQTFPEEEKEVFIQFRPFKSS